MKSGDAPVRRRIQAQFIPGFNEFEGSIAPNAVSGENKGLGPGVKSTAYAVCHISTTLLYVPLLHPFTQEDLPKDH